MAGITDLDIAGVATGPQTAHATPVHAGLIDAVARAVGPHAVQRGAEIPERRRGDANGPTGALPDLVLRPRDTAEVSRILAICDALRQPLVVQGGLTGFAGAARPLAGEAVLSLERMCRVGTPERVGASVLAEAGATLQAVQDVALDAGLMLGVDIAARGSCTIGGNVATNAGGIRVLRYGMFRAQVAGLEVVLADGTVLSSLTGLAKDNAGYDLKQIFIGSEGTLGVVTRARLRLHPRPPGSCLALAAVASPQAALEALMRLRDAFGPGLTAFEAIGGVLHDAVASWSAARSPIASGAPLYALIEIQGHDPDADRARFESTLALAIEDGLLAQTLIAASGREAAAFWGVREQAGAYLGRACGPTQGHDISVAIDRQPEFLARAETAIATIDPGARILVFGHFGDGNLHYIVESAEPRVTETVYRLVADMGGSIAAEHGIGLDKKSRLPLSRSAAEISTMRRLKRALDPHGILNPGRVFDPVPDGAAA